MNKKLKTVLIILFVALIAILILVMSNKYNEYTANKNKLSQLTVQEFINAFNQNLKDTGIEDEAQNDIASSNAKKEYKFKLESGMELIIGCDDEKTDLDADIVRASCISYSETLTDTVLTNKYLSILIKTNNPALSQEEIQAILEKGTDMTNSIEKDGTKTSLGCGYKGIGFYRFIQNSYILNMVNR